MVGIATSITDILYRVEKTILIIALVIFGLILALSNFVDMKFLEMQRNFSIFFISSTLFLAGFMHMLLEEHYRNIPHHVALDSEQDVLIYLGKLLDSVEVELCATHIYALPFTTDKILECADRKDDLRKHIRIVRIVGIQNEADKAIAKNTLEKKNTLECVELDLYVIDLSNARPVAETANVVIKDNKEALLIFPSRGDGKTKGIYINDEFTVREVIKDYWVKIKIRSTEGNTTLVNNIGISA
jgi:hypothetical protein